MDFVFFFFQAEDGIRYLVRSRGLGDVYKRQELLDFIESGFGGRQIGSWMRVSTRSDYGLRALIELSLIHI